MTGGRWNEKGFPVVHAAENRSLACLETLVHLGAGGLPLNRYLVEISIPDPVWATALRKTPTSLPVGWDAAPAGRASFGTDWLRSKNSAVLVIPLDHRPGGVLRAGQPGPPGQRQHQRQKSRRWLYDSRLTRASA